MILSQRNILEVQELQIDFADNSDIRPKETHELVSRRTCGENDIGYIKQDQKSYLRSKR